MKGWGVLLVLCFWACAERDNPYDPVNRAARPMDTGAKPPVPSASIRVVLPDSSGSRGSAYYGNIQAALADLNPGDTLWVQGNRTYPISGLLRVSHGGARLLPVVIRSYGGIARILARSAVANCLLIDTGGGAVHISGFAFVGATGPAILANGVAGDIWIDSCRIDTSLTAIEMRDITGTVHIHDVTMTADSLVPPVSFTGVSVLDTLRLRW
jgi:hypothetical protein